LVDAFKKRLDEGRGETLYEIGYDGILYIFSVSDSVEQGATMNLSETDLDVAYGTLCRVGAALDADCCLIHKTQHISGGWLGIVMMRKRADVVEALEIRVACMSVFGS
jgi:hypothetical protein